MPQRYVIVTPAFDDWTSFCHLIGNIDQKCRAKDMVFEVLAVDDGSSSTLHPEMLPPLTEHSCIDKVSIIELALNLGHQRAIAVGLVSVWMNRHINSIIVMDSDGEDRPDDLCALISLAKAHPDDIIFARRAKRSESLLFRMGYLAYRVLFHGLTGRKIAFGNFCVLPAYATRRLVHMPELWNNLPSAIIRSRLPYRSVPTARGTRYAGRSKMNLTGLVVHGLSSMSIYTDAIFVRVLLAISLVSFMSLLGMIATAAIRFGTSLAIPGWATTVVGDLLIILILLTSTTLVLLANRSTRQFVPAFHAAEFISDQRIVAERTASPV